MWACDPAVTGPILGSYQGTGPIFLNALQSILAAHCALVGDHVWPADASDSVIADPNYDFIVVGAGSAGAVVANRLTEIPNWKVLLVEAGGNPTLSTEAPQLFYANMRTHVDWNYRTQPQNGACRSYEHKGCAWPRGKVLGGSSTINGMFYVRGNKVDYDEWEAIGNKGWKYDDILQYFKKSENFNNPSSPDVLKYHGTGGYLNVEATSNIHDFEKLILKANEELGIKILEDVTGGNQMGVTRSLTTTKDGTRYSTARAFLSPIKNRPNLHVLKNAHVTKLLFKKNSTEVSGIEILKDNKHITVNAKKEVVLSAGTVNTPQILILSGIGPKEHLRELDIDLKLDLAVGRNLQDHALVPMFYTLESEIKKFSLSNIAGNVNDFLVNKKGPLSDTSPHKIIGFINMTDPNSSSPDIQQHYVVFPPNITNLLDMFGQHGFSNEFNNKFREMNKNKIFLIPCTVLLKPKSKGNIVLNSRNPLDPPLIYANYFDDHDDIQTVVRGMKFILQLGKTKTIQSAGFKLDWIDIEACREFEKSSDEHLECMARETTISLYHPVGTAKMGPDSDTEAVVDNELKVRGTKGLRVIDASVMPSVPRGNTNAPTIMIAEKGADLIKNYWIHRHTEL